MEANLKCDQCGGELIELKNVQGTYVCINCGSKKIITSDNNYNNYGVVNNYYGPNDENLIKTPIGNREKYIEKINTLIMLENYERLSEVVEEYIELFPKDYFGWGIKADLSLKTKKGSFWNAISQSLELADKKEKKIILDKIKEDLISTIINLVDNNGDRGNIEKYINFYVSNYDDEDMYKHLFLFELEMMLCFKKKKLFIMKRSSKAKKSFQKALELAKTDSDEILIESWKGYWKRKRSRAFILEIFIMYVFLCLLIAIIISTVTK